MNEADEVREGNIDRPASGVGVGGGGTCDGVPVPVRDLAGVAVWEAVIEGVMQDMPASDASVAVDAGPTVHSPVLEEYTRGARTAVDAAMA